MTSIVLPNEAALVIIDFAILSVDSIVITLGMRSCVQLWNNAVGFCQGSLGIRGGRKGVVSGSFAFSFGVSETC